MTLETVSSSLLWESNNGTFFILHNNLSLKIAAFAWPFMENSVQSTALQYERLQKSDICLMQLSLSSQCDEYVDIQMTHKLYMPAWKAVRLNYSPACEPNHTVAKPRLSQHNPSLNFHLNQMFFFSHCITGVIQHKLFTWPPGLKKVLV